MKGRIFRRVFILYIVILILSVSFINLYLTRVLRSSYIDSLKESLAVQTAIAADITPFTSKADYASFCREMKKKTTARVTIIDTRGTVLGDSDLDASTMENHADRPEIQQALGLPTGDAIRLSDTLKYELLYTARKIEHKGRHKGFIRLAVPLTRINASINSLLLKINLAVILIFLAFGIVLIWQTERIRKFVMQISGYAGALTHGLFKRKLYLENAGEFTELAHSLNNMASELEENIKTINEETKRLSVILKSIPDALLLINVQGVIELSNNAATELFTHSQLDGRPFLEVVRSPGFLALIDHVKQDRASGSTEITIDMPEVKFLTVRVSPLYYQVGELAGFVAIFHDTTQMKKLEQMRKDFVANVSHEIKTPVTAIQGFAETLLDGALYDRENAEKFLGTIKAHSLRLSRLVEDLLTISKLELGVIMIHKADFNIDDIIEEVIQTTLLQAAEKDIVVKKSLQTGEMLISGDRERVEQILLNLADNAIKFTEKGEIEIGISQDKGRNFLFVKDTGIGVPSKYLSRLGERFFRVDPSRSRELGGTGLGLAIVKHLVKALDWKMKIESKEGTGTVVKVYY
jgi:two-component system phosphate regulon sensor histidine kinase PhoR